MLKDSIEIIDFFNDLSHKNYFLDFCIYFQDFIYIYIKILFFDFRDILGI